MAASGGAAGDEIERVSASVTVRGDTSVPLAEGSIIQTCNGVDPKKLAKEAVYVHNRDASKAVKTSQSTPHRLQLKCSIPGCAYHFSARSARDSSAISRGDGEPPTAFEVVTHIEHTCVHPAPAPRQRHTGSHRTKAVATTVTKYLSRNPAADTKEVRAYLYGQGVDMGKGNADCVKLTRVIAEARVMSGGTPQDNVQMLIPWCEAFVDASPANRAKVFLGQHEDFVDIDGRRRTRAPFEGISVTFGSTANMFNADDARKLLVLDAAHCKSDSGGTYVVAATVSSSNNVETLNIAYGVGSESNKLLAMSVSEVREACPELDMLPEDGRPQYIVLADRGPAIIWAINTQLRNCFHCWCSLHLKGNVQTRFGHPGVALLEAMTYAGTLEECMKVAHVALQEAPGLLTYLGVAKGDDNNGVVKEELIEIDSMNGQLKWAHFALAFREAALPGPAGDACGRTSSQLAECTFSAWGDLRKLPFAMGLTKIVEQTLATQQKEKAEVLRLSEQGHNVSGRVRTAIMGNLNKGKDKLAAAKPLGDGKAYAVSFFSGKGSHTLRVVGEEGKAGSCACERPRREGIPCAHLAAVVKHAQETNTPFDPTLCVAPVLSLARARQQYRHVPLPYIVDILAMKPSLSDIVVIHHPTDPRR